MYIKSLIIQGFKSYKNKTKIDFSSGQNIIVGQNGSGKSNIFAAIEFLLSNKYNHLTTEQKAQLIYEDLEQCCISASVEMICDNKDMRFPINAPNLSIKRVITAKSDEYFINQKHSPKGNVDSLFESAGIPRSNCYFIVQQGKVNKIIKMSDKERLELLKEIAGTKVYEEKRNESVRLLEESSAKNEHIQQIISQIEKKIKNLEIEKKELAEFEEKDQIRRKIESKIFLIKLKTITKKHEKLKNAEKSRDFERDKIATEIENLDSKKENLLKRAKECADQILFFKAARKKAIALKRKEQRNLAFAVERKEEAQSVFDANKDFLDKIGVEIDELEKLEIKELKRSQILGKEINQIEEKKTNLSKQLEKAKNLILILQLKSGRSDTFSTKEKRDKFLTEQIKNKTEANNSVFDKIKRMEDQINEIKSDSLELEISRLEKESKLKEEKLIKIDSDFSKELNCRNDLAVQRKKIWKELSEVREEKKMATEKLRETENNLRFAMSREQFNTINNIKKIVAENGIKGYHGILGELVNVKNNKFYKCVEKVAGNRLFFHVVDDDSIAAKIINKMNKNNVGRATFMPLNRLYESNRKFSKTLKDAIPMIDNLIFDSKFKSAIQQVFGKTLIAKSIEAARECAKTEKLDAITLDGDRAFKKGTLSGGYEEHRFSRLKALISLKDLKNRLPSLRKTESDLEQNSAKIDQKITNSSNILNELQSKKDFEQKSLFEIKTQLRQAFSENELAKNTLLKLTKTASIMKNSSKENEKIIKQYQTEIKTPFKMSLNEMESKNLDFNLDKEKQLEMEISEISTTLFDKTLEKEKIDQKLSKNIKCRLQNLKDHQARKIGQSKAAQLSARRYALEQSEFSELSSEKDQNAKSAMAALKKYKNLAKTVTAEFEALSTAKNSAEKRLESLEANAAVFKGRLSALAAQKDELISAINALGVDFFGDEFGQNFVENDDKNDDKKDNKKDDKKEKNGVKNDEKNREKNDEKTNKILSEKIREIRLENGEILRENASEKELLEALKKAKENLKAVGMVNRKALDQFSNFRRQRNELLQRKKQQDKGENAIRDLISHLDRKKDEAIDRTFRTIAQNFSNVFKELVPTGFASLQLVSKSSKIDEKSSKLSKIDEKSSKKSKIDENSPKLGQKSEIEIFSNSSGIVIEKMKDMSQCKGVSSSKYVGVAIQVSFSSSNPSNPQSHSIKSLSGGQQTLCALALIFAIQRCDPSPFYFLDEIDANLDEAHRLAVTALLRKAAAAQMVSTTFKAEFLEGASKFFVVSQSGKESVVEEANFERARGVLDFGED